MFSVYKDTHDLQVTCASDAALQAYIAGVECSLRFDAPAIDEFAEAVALDEEFALAHAALGRQLFIHGRGEKCAAHLDIALSLKERATQREQDAINVIERAARFDPQAMAMASAHVVAYPQDAYVLAHLLGPFGMFAFSGIPDFCAKNIALLEETRSSYSANNWWHAANRGFFAAEQGNLPLAREECELAWSLSENGNTAHAMAHMHFEAGALEEGSDFITAWATNYGSRSDMRHHLMWHTSLLDLESGVEIEQISALYERELDPTVNDPTPLETLCDNASFLWRCFLAGKEMPASMSEALTVYAETHFSHIGFAFADVHRAMATALHPDKNKHAEFVAALTDVSRNNKKRVAECVRLFAKAFGAFVNESYDEVATILEPVVEESVLLGGSNPQRRIVEETLVEACIRCGQSGKANEIVQRRKRNFVS